MQINLYFDLKIVFMNHAIIQDKQDYVILIQYST